MLFVTKNWPIAASLAAIAVFAASAQAQLAPTAISEVYIDSPGSPDVDEYFEVCGSGTYDSEDDYKYYFVQLENENNSNEGEVDFVVELTGNFNGNGVMWVSEDSETLLGNPDQLYPGQTIGYMENSGGTFLLVKMAVASGTAPALTDDWDSNDDGVLEVPTGFTIIDSVGVVCEVDDVCPGAKLYGAVNFFAGWQWQEELIENPDDTEDDPYATNFQVDNCYGPLDEIEFLGRCDDCGGEWFAAGVNRTGSSGSRVLTVDTSPTGGRPKAIAETMVPFAANATCSSPGNSNVGCSDQCACE